MEYIKLSRGLLDWEWYQEINTKVLFIHMLLKANWKDGKYKGTTVPRGSFVSSIAKLAGETALTPDEVRTAIRNLTASGAVTKQSTNKYTLFTVKNYDMYQSNPKQDPSSAQAIPKPFPTIEEKKEGKKERKEIPPISPVERFEDFLAAYPKPVRNRHATEQAYCRLLREDCGLKEQDLVAAAGNYADEVGVLGTEERYVKNPENFLTNRFFAAYLDGDYRRPEPVKKKSVWAPGEQREYDMEQLEEELLAN